MNSVGNLGIMEKRMNTRLSKIQLILGLLLIAALACNFTPEGSSDDRSATVEALSTSVAATSTAIASEEESTPAVEEVKETATQEAVEVQVTEDLQSTEVSSQLAATEAALGPIKGELTLYGVDPQQGQLAWVHPPLTLEIDQYRGSAFGNNFPMVIVQDFVLSADITWDTEYGAAGCAFVFRSDGDQAKPTQYMVWMTRLTNGRIEFTVMYQGEIVGLRDFYANGIDPKFDGENGVTNRLAVVGRGKQFTIFTNGTKIGDADSDAPLPPLVLPDPPVRPNTNNPNQLAAYQRELSAYRLLVSRLKNEYNTRAAIAKKANKDYPAGIVAMGVLADSGRTMCQFDNAWLFLIAPPQ